MASTKKRAAGASSSANSSAGPPKRAAAAEDDDDRAWIAVVANGSERVRGTYDDTLISMDLYRTIVEWSERLGRFATARAAGLAAVAFCLKYRATAKSWVNADGDEEERTEDTEEAALGRVPELVRRAEALDWDDARARRAFLEEFKETMIASCNLAAWIESVEREEPVDEREEGDIESEVRDALAGLVGGDSDSGF